MKSEFKGESLPLASTSLAATPSVFSTSGTASTETRSKTVSQFLSLTGCSILRNAPAKLFLLLGIFCLPQFISARSRQELVRSGHWIYDAVAAISLESGIRNFADCAPLTIAEIESYLSEIDTDSLSEAGLKQLHRIQDYFGEGNLSFKSDVFSADFEPSFNPEFYYKTNDEIGWVYDRYSRNNIIDAPVTLSVKDYVALGMDIHLGENKGASSHNDNYLNIPTKDTEVDVNFPNYGYLSTGYKFTERTGLSFQLGMGEQSIGRTSTGSIILSDYMTGASFGKISIYSPNLKYTFDTIQLNVDKYMYYHEFTGRFFNKLTLGFMEATLTNAPWELRYINPFTVYHGMAPWRDYGEDDSHNGEFMGLRFDFVPFRCLRVFGTFAMNQYQVPYERRDFADSLTPNSLGGQAGFEAMIPAGGGYVKLSGEGYYAQPTLYIKQSPDWSFFRTYTDNIGDNAVFYEWTGSPLGPDTIAGELSVGYENPGKWSLDLIYLFAAQGKNAEKSIFYDKASKTWYSSTDNDNTKIKTGHKSDVTTPDGWCYPTSENGINQYAETPTDVPKYTHRVSLKGKWQATDWLSFTFQPSFVAILNNTGSSGFHERGNNEYGFEGALAVKLKLIRKIRN